MSDAIGLDDSQPVTFEEFSALSPAQQRDLMIADGVVCRFDDPNHFDIEACPSCKESKELRCLHLYGAQDKLIYVGTMGGNNQMLYWLGKSPHNKSGSWVRGKNPDRWGRRGWLGPTSR
jgi:hypothetical protein